MKKKTIRKIVSLAAAALIVCSLSAGAFATVKTIAVTVKAGQNLEGICRENGVDFGQNKKLIMSLNGFSNSGQMNRILAGSTIILPAPESGEARPAGPVTIVAGDASKMMPGDKVAYYVVLYTIRPGDILTNLYNQWESELGAAQRQMIMSLNGLNNIDRLVVDKMLYLPVNRGDIAGMANYTVLAHTIGYNEFVGEICRGYGLDFDTARASLQYFNPDMDFAHVNAGQVLYIPVVGNPTPAAVPAVSAVPAAAPVTAITSEGAVAAAESGAAPALAPLVNIDVLPTEMVYDGYAVVKDCGTYLSLQLENPDVEFTVAYTQESMQGYFPRPGDYVKVIFTPTDYLLVSIQYIYNVFTGA